MTNILNSVNLYVYYITLHFINVKVYLTKTFEWQRSRLTKIKQELDVGYLKSFAIEFNAVTNTSPKWPCLGCKE